MILHQLHWPIDIFFSGASANCNNICQRKSVPVVLLKFFRRDRSQCNPVCFNLYNFELNSFETPCYYLLPHTSKNYEPIVSMFFENWNHGTWFSTLPKLRHLSHNLYEWIKQYKRQTWALQNNSLRR